MKQPAPLPRGLYSLWIKVFISAWVFVVIFLYLLLFGSPEYWLFAERLGLRPMLESWKSWLEPFFTADYLT